MEDKRDAAQPRFSIITAVHNVSHYLPEFIASIDAQGFPDDLLEVVAVDDGSTDDSLLVLQDWARRATYEVCVITKANGGQASARNVGMERATGEWVTFADPDDMLGPAYLAIVDSFIRDNDQVEMVATNRIFYDDATGALVDRHPLRKHFRKTRLVNIERHPFFFQGSAPAAFMRLGEIRRHGLTFDERIRPNFEDGHFCARYLLVVPHPWIGFVREAEYLYRRRADRSSTLQNSVADPRRYTVVPEVGYLGLLEFARERLGRVPDWVQNFIIYELSWYFSAEDAPFGSMTAAVGDAADALHAIMPRIRANLDDIVIEAHRVRTITPVWRDMLLHAWTESTWHSPYVVADPADFDTGLVRIVYRYIGDPPTEEFLVRGLPVQPRHSKVRSITYFDRTLMHERIVWISLRGTIRVRLNGRATEIKDEWDPPKVITLNLAPGSSERSPSLPRQAVELVRGRVRRDPEHMDLRAAERSRDRYSESWVLVDRIHNADDSAEVLFRYLRRSRPDINAWFTVEEGTADWRRLQQDGYGDRLVAWGSPAWKSLMANCSYLISSHIDVPIHRPPEILAFTEPRWKFCFLQHGIIKDDISNWLNTKELSLFVTSTAAEYASIAGDGTRYVFTTKEVQNTGLPRFDALLSVGEEYPPERRDLVLVAPTWRHWLAEGLDEGSQRRTVREGFWETDYARNWMGLLASDRLGQAARDRGIKIGFLPHPNLQLILDEAELPEHVLPLRLEGSDIRSFFGRAAALVTDYSSMAFNVAYLDRPVSYFQFDADRMFGGGHVGRGGYFDYERDGLGPVAYDLDTAIDDLVAIVEAGPQPAPMYRQRIAETFPVRDGRNCERVTAEIEALRRRLTPQELSTPVPTPVPPH